MNMQTIPLTQLIPSPLNVRKTGSKDGIERLPPASPPMACCKTCRCALPTKDGSRLWPEAAASRRLQLLAKQKQIAADYPVPCHALDGADATEISLAENEMRLPMHPADQFDAFKKLADDGKGPEEIAARFGTTAKTVIQRLKLAVVSPKLIALYRKDEMTLDCLMAFTVTDSQKQQEKVWKELPEWARQRPDRIRDALTEKHIAADSRTGAIRRQRGLRGGRRRGVARPVRRRQYRLVHRSRLGQPAGGGNARPRSRRSARRGLEMGRDHPRTDVGSAEHVWQSNARTESRRPRSSSARSTASTPRPTPFWRSTARPEDEAVVERFDAIQEQIALLSEGEELWPDAAKAMAGAVITIGRNGILDIRRGLIRPEDKAEARKASKAKHAAASGQKGEEAPAPGSSPGQALSAALIEDLTAHRTAALQARLAAQPKVALIAVRISWPLRYSTPATAARACCASAWLSLTSTAAPRTSRRRKHGRSWRQQPRPCASGCRKTPRNCGIGWPNRIRGRFSPFSRSAPVTPSILSRANAIPAVQPALRGSLPVRSNSTWRNTGSPARTVISAGCRRRRCLRP